jgi:hypothetical protein
VSSQVLMIAIEIALAIGLFAMYQAARKAFSIDEARRAAIEETDRLIESIETLAKDIRETTDRSMEDLSAALARAEDVIARLEKVATSPRSATSDMARHTSPARGRAARVKNLRSVVLELSAQGMDPAAIAKETNVGVGEVELMLGLSRRAAPAARRSLFAGSDTELLE